VHNEAGVDQHRQAGVSFVDAPVVTIGMESNNECEWTVFRFATMAGHGAAQ
jgi:hypothetical protein